MNDAQTPLLALLRKCTQAERLRLAEIAGTTVNYLYALAGCHRSQPNLELGLAIANATVILNGETRNRTPIVTPHELASMCKLAGMPSGPEPD